MAVELSWSNQALEDLMDIYVRIGLAQPAAAEKYYNRIQRRSQMLPLQPRMGVRRPDIRPSARMLVEWPFLILYETEPDTDTGPIDAVEIVRVVDGRRDLSAIF